ncbi:hypothetical protein CMI37_11280 [Candidatus Pacearchaeota archaeon]|nr:hypothetical protein [Candidatus Pacearchaeota archaeon]|tara:strand:+ start:2298 stop:2597 length:300 start_codon:yes stop_codon:yes gene_type:complete
MAEGSIKLTNIHFLWTAFVALVLGMVAWGAVAYFPMKDGVVLAGDQKALGQKVDRLVNSQEKSTGALNELVGEMREQRGREKERRELLDRRRRDDDPNR